MGPDGMPLTWWFGHAKCRDCSRGQTAVYAKTLFTIMLFCPQHAMDYVKPRKQVALRRKFDIELPDHIGPKPDA